MRVAVDFGRTTTGPVNLVDGRLVFPPLHTSPGPLPVLPPGCAGIRGLHVATVLVVQTLEHMLAGLLHMSGRDGRWGFADILKIAVEDGMISANECTVFDRLRTLRNPYVHARLPLADGRLEARAIADDTDNYAVMEGAAPLAITTFLRLMRRPPFDPGA